jgi:CheY-like chemotaxis protein
MCPCSVEPAVARSMVSCVPISSANGSSFPVVLVVEDDFLVRYGIAEFLRNCGCVVLEAFSAEEAVALGHHHPVNVLMTDIDLRDGSTGWDVAEALRAANPAIGVIYVSGNSVDCSRRVRDSYFFEKPYCDSVIFETCRELAHA